MKILINPRREQWDEILERPSVKGQATEEKVSQMLTDLKVSGWEEVCRMTNEFDGYIPEPALVPEDELTAAGNLLPAALKHSIALAANNIRKFHESQVRTANLVDISPGIACYQKWVPIERIGLYIPGGSAPLFSTVLMLAIPAQIAGCSELTLCTPGNRQGIIHPAILYAAAYCGIKRVYRLGGVQAIASMAFGLGPVPKVDKIFGPGNAWVTMAKQLISRAGVAIDMPAGPSELLVVADDSASPAFVAADLLSQAEHGTDSQVLLLTSSWELAEQVHYESELQLTKLPRKDIAAKSLEHSRIIVLPDQSSIMEMVNRYAPEHLVIATENYKQLAGQVKHAGSVFLGHYSPESAGDYASGTNHTLPTSGFARAYSGLSVDSFMKSITFQELTREGLRSIEPAIRLMAMAEGLEGHAIAAEIRQKEFKTIKRGSGEIAETNDYPSHSEEDTGSKYHIMDYLNPLNILYPLNILDPENELNPLNLLNRLVPEKPESPVSKPGLIEQIRPNIAALIPYSSARDEFSGHEGIFMDANENPNETGLNRYPDPRQTELRDLVANLKGIGPECVFLGNGSDEAIDLLIRIFCEPRMSRIITIDPTYGMYAVCAGIQDVEVDRVLLNADFSVNAGALLNAVRFDTKMIFLCSPNNPTGNQIPVDEIRYLADRFSGIIVVDEAYIDFAQGPSALTLIGQCPNIAVLQTFSKAWGLAGVRLGMAFAGSEIIRNMNKVKYPYNINVLSASTVREIVRGVSDVTGEKSGKNEKNEKNEKTRKILTDKKTGPDVREILWERNRLASSLKEIPAVVKVFPSDANFLLVKFADPKRIYKHLADHGIIVRDRSNQSLCEGCLRITAGTPAENNKLIEVLGQTS
jgi:histidinol dehydrogenase